MKQDILKGKWKQLKGQAQKKWGKLTDDELDQIQGNKDMLIGKLQEKYGYTRDQAQQQIDQWMQEAS